MPSSTPPIELDRASIRTGCETEANRQADLELHRLGYTFNASEQRWEKAAPGSTPPPTGYKSIGTCVDCGFQSEDVNVLKAHVEQHRAGSTPPQE